jgi:hypothetical protein
MELPSLVIEDLVPQSLALVAGAQISEEEV